MAKLMFNLLRAGFTCCVPCWPPARHVCVGNITSTSYQLDLLQHLAKNLPSSMPVPVQKIQCTKLLRPRSTTKHPGRLCAAMCVAAAFLKAAPEAPEAGGEAPKARRRPSSVQ